MQINSSVMVVVNSNLKMWCLLYSIPMNLYILKCVYNDFFVHILNFDIKRSVIFMDKDQ